MLSHEGTQKHLLEDFLRDGNDDFDSSDESEPDAVTQRGILSQENEHNIGIDEGFLPGTKYDETDYLRNYKISQSGDFMDQVTYSVPIKGLYKIKMQRIGYEGNEFQAVLLKIEDKKLQ